MDKNLIEKYKNEMLNLYRSSRPMALQQSANQQNIQPPEPEPAPMPEPLPMPAPTLEPAELGLGSPLPGGESRYSYFYNGKGQLIGIVTSLKGIYPVKGAKVTVFTGNYEDMTVLDSSVTDSSGRTKAFLLSAPAKALSEEAGASQKPYASYNMLVDADGYVDNIHLNIPVFSGVVSLQSSDLMLTETAGENTEPRIFDEAQEFTL